MGDLAEAIDAIERDGCALLHGVVPADQLSLLKRELAAQLAPTFKGSLDAVRHRDGAVYAARNVLDLSQAARDAWRHPPLPELLQLVLGSDCGLVRGLYFDKPPDQTWALPWHKDLLIAVKRGSGRSQGFSPPRDRAGVPHCEPPTCVLERMLTLRIHLDPATEANGPLEVMPGSHRTGKQLQLTGFSPRKILGDAGDVFAMRPLLAHASGRSHAGTSEHRRVLHLEFAADPSLPDGFEWNCFVSCASAS